MKEKVELLNCGLFNTKQTGVKGSILKYRLLNNAYCVETKYLKGYSEFALFTNNDELFNLLQPSDFGVAAEIEYISVAPVNNPLQKKMKAAKLKIGSSTISLL